MSRQPLVEGLVVVAEEPLDVQLLALHVSDVVVAVEDDVVDGPALDHGRDAHLADLNPDPGICEDNEKDGKN